MATEKRLIDAKFAQHIANVELSYDEAGTVQWVLSHTPTVDAVEVVHAHWDEWWPGDCALIMTGEEKLYQCSSCSAKFSDVDGFQYCPHCGAFMDGGSTDEP